MDFKEAKYRYTDTDHPDLWAVEITEGKFTGVKYKYTVWNIERDLAQDKRRLKFNYEMIENPQAVPDLEDKKDKEFLSLMGNILLNILLEKAKIEPQKSGE